MNLLLVVATKEEICIIFGEHHKSFLIFLNNFQVIVSLTHLFLVCRWDKVSQGHASNEEDTLGHPLACISHSCVDYKKNYNYSVCISGLFQPSSRLGRWYEVLSIGL